MRLNVKSKEFNIIHIKMRRLFFFTVAVVGLMLMAGCHDRKAAKVMGMNDSVDVEADNDSTIYGVCGEGTSMHSLAELLALSLRLVDALSLVDTLALVDALSLADVLALADSL